MSTAFSDAGVIGYSWFQPTTTRVLKTAPPEAVEEYRAGGRIDRVAKKFHISPCVLRRSCLAAGVPIRKQGTPTDAAVRSRFQARCDEFRRRYLAGETLQAIAADHGITRERVRQVLSKAGVPSLGYRDEHKRKPHPLTEAERRAASLYERGVAPSIIARETGLTPSQINNARERLGIPAKPMGSFNIRPDDAEITARVAELYRAGMGAKEIAQAVPQLKYPETVYRYLKKAGIEPRRKVNRRAWDRSPDAMAERDRRVVELHAAGATCREIAEGVGLYIQTVYTKLAQKGLKPNPRPRKSRESRARVTRPYVRPLAPSFSERAWEESELATLNRLWKDGATAAQIGRELSRSRNAVLGKIHRLGLNRRP